TPPPPLGTLARSVAWRLPENLGRKYARISGDYNPIHLSALTARPFGFRRAIIHGMWTKARCLAQLDLRAPCEIAVHFLRPASLPSAVYFNADQDGRFEVISARSSKRLLVGEARAPEE
ncbi:MAG: MaoC/PaaZ C-terminal domain-containing protein, partial [Myxococcota bacterium]